MKSQPPTRADARRNYERLITTAREVFLEQGTEAPLDDIVKRAGVGSATLYRHFPTREDLLHAVLEDWIEDLLAQAEELLSASSPVDALATWLRAYLAGMSATRGTSAALIAAMASPWGATRLGASSAAICNATERLLRRAQEAGQIRQDVDASDVVRIANAIGIAAERTADPARNIPRMLSIFLDGLRHTT
jgi:AcrR family transcriptional regulator